MKPLEGIKVVDMTRILAGPWAAQMLADLGAEIIKIEQKDTGDDTRGWGPPYLKDAQGEETAEAAYFLSINRGKKSFVVDFRNPKGRDIVAKLVDDADILLENYKFGGLAKYQLDYASLSKTNSKLIYCSITGFGQTGPNREKPGYDAMIQAMAGMMSVNGPADDEPGGAPQKVGIAVADLFAGFYAANAIQAALIQRGRTGKGQHIDIALYDCQLAAMINQGMNYLISGVSPGRMGTAHPNLVPYQVFATKDGHLMVAIGNNPQFKRLVDLLGLGELGNDKRFDTNRGRVENRQVLIPLLMEAFAKNNTDHWRAALEAENIPHGPVRSLDEVFASDQAKARELRVELDHPQAGSVPLIACPIRMSESEIGSRLAPPLLGQHSAEILRERLGLSEEEIAALEEEGVVQTAS